MTGIIVMEFLTDIFDTEKINRCLMFSLSILLLLLNVIISHYPFQAFKKDNNVYVFTVPLFTFESMV